MATAPAPPAEVDLSRVAETFIKIRNAKAHVKAELETVIEKYDTQLETINAFLLNYLNARNANSIATEFGTIYRKEAVKPSIADDKAFFAWVAQNMAFDAMHRRVSETFVKEYMESHKDEQGNLGPPPPGLNVHRFYEVVVRKPS